MYAPLGNQLWVSRRFVLKLEANGIVFVAGTNRLGLDDDLGGVSRSVFLEVVWPGSVKHGFEVIHCLET